MNPIEEKEMIKPRALAVLFISIGLLLSLESCAKPPIEEMENAESALTRAENNPDAAAYAEDSLIRARDARNRMQVEAEAKRYDTARAYAAETINAAEKALADGRAAAVRAREDAVNLIATLKDSLEETEKALAAARKIPRSSLDFEALSDGLENARRLIAHAEVAVAGNRLREALDRGRAARAALGDLMAAISAGAREVSRKQ
jgi:flagellar biosynthesis/type III secretory pathway protein FliH